jgi:hypothetical protein
MTSASAPGHLVPDRLVLRNTLYLVVAQILVVPLSVFVNALIARVLGPAEFGQLYLATTYATFAFLFVEWGQSKTLTGNVARETARAGELLGSGLVWRIGASLVTFAVLTGICLALGYDRSFLSILALVTLAAALATISSACQDVFRGFERTDYSAASTVGFQLLAVIVVAPHARTDAAGARADDSGAVPLRCPVPRLRGGHDPRIQRRCDVSLAPRLVGCHRMACRGVQADRDPGVSGQCAGRGALPDTMPLVRR